MSKDFLSKMTVFSITFDELSFIRRGLKNESEADVSLVVDTSVSQDETLYKVTVKAKVVKESEYDLMVSLSGIFMFDDSVSEDVRDVLLRNNAVAILMPYVRSQIAILTAQPDTDSLILPVLDIAKMVEQGLTL